MKKCGHHLWSLATLFIVIVTWSVQSSHGAMLNTYVSSDGRTYYNTPLMCDSGLLVSPYLKYLRQSYTSRDDKDCCYLADTRNNCCFSNTECRCSTSVTCGLPTTTSTSTTTTTSTTPTTTTTTSTSTTSTTTTPTTTTTSTTTTTTPPTSTTTPTTTTTTTTSTTTVQPRIASLCALTNRVLNGVNVKDSCTYMGIANITISNFTTCHAVLTTATVNGTYKTTFLTAGICKRQLSSTQQFDLEIGIQKYPIPSVLFSLYDGKSFNDSLLLWLLSIAVYLGETSIKAESLGPKQILTLFQCCLL
uniref:Uncharacterized protein n=1 Tax=Biomphalaria glabrata TaxID=6526 RepID=A0A2C9KFF8_BIOGL